MVLKKLCIKVDLTYVGNGDPSEAEIVKNVKLAGGCFIDNNVAYYSAVPLSEIETSNGMHEYELHVPIEVRNEADPYVVFTGIETLAEADMHIFFWLSMVCLLAAFILIFLLACYYNLYISQ